MTEQEPNFHDTVASELADVVHDAPNGYAPLVPIEGKHSFQTTDMEGQRHSIEVSSSTIYGKDRRGDEYKNEISSSAEVASNPIAELNAYPEVHVATGNPAHGTDIDLGLRNSKARMRHTVRNDKGTKASLAEVHTPAGTYTAKESHDTIYDVTGTFIERPGYGSVEIKNPKARQLVARLAGKAIQKVQTDIQEVKGKEEVGERDWVKATRRTARRVMGKKVA